MEFLLLLALICSFFYFRNRISRIEWDVEELKRVVAGTSKHETHVDEVTRGNDAVIGATKEAPQPLPAPVFVSETQPASSSIESQEEKSARWLGRIGAAAILLGVVFFLRYAFESGLIGETGRVAIGILFGVLMVGVGQKIRTQYLNYSDILVACGVGVLYLSVYAVHGFYHLVSAEFAIGLMTVVTAFVLSLAVIDNSMGLAVFAILGGFATPILLSTGQNNLFGLSLYMIVLDLGVLGVALFKKWFRLHVLAFIGTIVLFAGWMGSFYVEAELSITLFFATVFFVIFVVTSILHHFLRKEPTTLWDLGLITSVAAWYFAVGYYILHFHHHEFLGFFALVLAALYLSCAYVSFTTNLEHRSLNLFLSGIAVVFLTTAVPLQFSGYAISIAWLIEAVVLLLTALYLRERVLQLFAWIVLMFGIGKVVVAVSDIQHAFAPPAVFWNIGFFLMCVSIGVLYMFAFLYYRFNMSSAESRKAMFIALVLASAGTALMCSVELGRTFLSFQPLAWLAEGLLMLAIGIYARSSMMQVVGWVCTAIGIFITSYAVTDLHRDHGITLGGVTSDTPAFFHMGTLMMIISVAMVYVFAYLYKRNNAVIPNWKKISGALIVIANILTITCVTWEISYYYELATRNLYRAVAVQNQANQNYYGVQQVSVSDNQQIPFEYATVEYQQVINIDSSKKTTISIFWAIYATLLLIIGFAKRSRELRIFGLAFFFVTAGRVFLIVWELGALARIISSIAFGFIALAASFLYAKYKSRLKEIILD